MKDSGASIFRPCVCTEGSTKAPTVSTREAWEKISDSLRPPLPSGQPRTFETSRASTCDLLKAVAEVWRPPTPCCTDSR